MSDETSAQSATIPIAPESPLARADGGGSEMKDAAIALISDSTGNKAHPSTEFHDGKELVTKDLTKEPTTAANENFAATETDGVKMETEKSTEAPGSTTAGEGSADPATATPASASKSKARRKSAGVPEHKNKKLNKKASRVKMSHADAKPGDYYFIKLKGYPLWPGIVCDESMLPQSLISSRPVTAARADGSYRADYEDGGKKVHDRTFPVMYLYTNEFGWIPNHDLIDLDLDQVGNVDTKMRKDLYQAHQLAGEKHDLDYFKQVLLDFQAAREAEAEAKAAAKAAKEASKASGKSKKKAKAAADIDQEENDDVEMADADGDLDVDGGAPEKKPKPSKKRKAVADADESTTPQASTSAKKLKFKPITSSTPKAANGNTPKSTTKKDASTKASKSKPKKSATNGTGEKSVATVPKEPELSPEEKRVKKEKEILFLRHKLQKGLLTRDQQPKEEEMKQMSEFISKLEGYADLEVSIIRATKINKVLKAILKLTEIPKESEFQFKDRSKSLLEKWNKILESAEQPIASNPTPTSGDGVGLKELTNGVAALSKTEGKGDTDSKAEAKADEPVLATRPEAAKPDVETEEAPTGEAIPVEELAKAPVDEPIPV